MLGGDVLAGILVLVLGLEAYYAVYGVKARGVPRVAIALASPVVLAAVGLYYGVLPGGVETGLLLFTLFAAALIASIRFWRVRGAGLAAVAIVVLVWLGGWGLYQPDPRGGLLVATLLPLALLLAGLAVGLVSEKRVVELRVVGLVSLLACALPLGYWLAAETRIHQPFIGEPLIVLLWLLGVTPLLSRFEVSRLILPPVIGGLAAGVFLGYTPYVEPLAKGLEYVGVVAESLIALAYAAYTAARKGFRVAASEAAIVSVVAIASLVAAYSAAYLHVQLSSSGLLFAVALLAAGIGAVVKGVRLEGLGLFVAATVLIASLLSAGVHSVMCSVEPVGLDGLAPAPKPDPRVVHSYYPLYWGVLNESTVYAWLAPIEGKVQALEFVRFVHAIRVAALKKGLRLDGLNLSMPYPEEMPRLIARLECLSTTTPLGPSVAEVRQRISLNSSPIETIAGFIQPLELRLEPSEARRLALDYLVMVSDPNATERNAIRYAIYTALVISWSEYRSLNDTARLLFYYALSPNTTIQPVKATLVVYNSPLCKLAAMLAPLAAACPIAAEFVRFIRKGVK